ncbi:hypothetical protein ATY35_19925 [Vibrio cidicii]|uniref:Chromosome partitioning protein ParA n=1 Tax=Vibrio cidicii TaxID=1763883 RepID=A0ABR5VX74_9VIBR|nr:hypothetical protein [Vibrio cidicii]KYN81400.1 hypothetical protein ATY35_19925 [Vibrio cidicii]
MKYEELEILAQAIIDSNDKLIYLNLLIILVGIVAVYFVAMFKKSGELTALKLAFDDIRKQNEIITTDTEEIKRQMEKGTIEYQIKLSKYHERKIESLDLVYKALVSIYRSGSIMLLKNEEHRFEAFYTTVHDFRDVFESNKIWLDPKICESIEQFAITIDSQVRRYEGTVNVAKLPGWNEAHQKRTFDKHQNFYDFCVSESNNLKDQLESVLRAYISPENEA